MTITIAGFWPMPKRGIISPRRAMLGIACTTFAAPIMGLSSFLT